MIRKNERLNQMILMLFLRGTNSRLMAHSYRLFILSIIGLFISLQSFSQVVNEHFRNALQQSIRGFEEWKGAKNNNGWEAKDQMEYYVRTEVISIDKDRNALQLVRMAEDVKMGYTKFARLEPGLVAALPANQFVRSTEKDNAFADGQKIVYRPIQSANADNMPYLEIGIINTGKDTFELVIRIVEPKNKNAWSF
jgi:hypothetical protein